ncbi:MULTISPECIES: DUF1484 family protein [unclassified Cupriavidus]|uniref:DUF1484 family protein n=1 Tax=unclassified Cupriavidus TaxID=2640874 RepID=UPI001AE468C5|nr:MULTISPECIES: DUF1484 family protein [unclassified Cupriavidus]MBP0630863.1 DUF1484 family protein [Cupriavidus sp. AcVe19-1a]MBP0634216.1 DUF1484 family protein [Cupriavidus sp. AcVe19-6a]
MQMRTYHAEVLNIVPPGAVETLERISAGRSAILSLLEIESERSESCHAMHSLLAMVKQQLDETTGEFCPAD